jgi:hypothetical protein
MSYVLYDPGCSSRIRILTFSPSRLPDPRVKKAPDPGSATLEKIDKDGKPVSYTGTDPEGGALFRSTGNRTTCYTSNRSFVKACFTLI